MRFKLCKSFLLLTLTASMFKSSSGFGNNGNFNRQEQGQGIILRQGRRGVTRFRISASDALNEGDLELDKIFSIIANGASARSSRATQARVPGRSARDIKQQHPNQNQDHSKHLVDNTSNPKLNKSEFAQTQNRTATTNSTKAVEPEEEGGTKAGVLIAVGILVGIVALGLVLCYCVPTKKMPGSRLQPAPQPRHANSQDHVEGRLPPATVSLIGSGYKPRSQRAAERMAAEAQQQELQQQHYVPVWQPIPRAQGVGPPKPREQELLPPAQVHYKKVPK